MAGAPFSTELSRRGPASMRVLDEAVSLLRRAPLALHSIYFLGALPQCLAVIYFYFDMTQSADAEKHLVPEALLITLLYFWMKTCQAVYARKLLALLEGEDRDPWTPRRWINTALLQAIYAGTYPIVYPLAVLIAIPFGWVSAFYHNISIVGTGAQTTVRESLTEAVELSRIWPKQNHLILAIMAAASLFLFGNLAIFFSIIPELLNMFFGLSTIFDENGSAWNNSSFYLDVAVFCFLVLNPLSKAVYALRCFYGRSRLTGADLKAELRRQNLSRQKQGPVGVLALVILLCAIPIHADPPLASVSAPSAILPTPAPVIAPAPPTPARPPAELDRAIQKTLQKDEFAWRLPREEDAQAEPEGFWGKLIHRIGKFVGDLMERIEKAVNKFLKWLFKSDEKHDHTGNGWATIQAAPWRAIFIGVLVVVVMGLVVLLLRYFRRNPVVNIATAALAPVKTVDLESETVRADDLPEDSWLALAHQLMEKGELRLALRALYLATLSVLARAELVKLAAAKSNRDYLTEVTRRLRGNSEAVQLFRENINLFEASWYGTHAVTTSIIDTMLANHQQVRGHASP